MQGAEHAAAEARAVAADNALAVPLFISGATGVNAAGINGLFEPTQEKGADGRVLYAKRGDSSICMEHAVGKWQIKPVSSKGTDCFIAFCQGGCAAEACTSRRWMTFVHNKTFSDAPHVKMVAGAEAQRQVGCCCLHAHWNHPLHTHFVVCFPSSSPYTPVIDFVLCAGR